MKARPLTKSEIKRAKAALTTLPKHPAEVTEDIIPLIVRFINQQMAERYLKQAQPTAPLQDRLFDALMTRFEVMEEYRGAILVLANLCQKTPNLSLVMARAQWDSTHYTLELVQSSNNVSCNVFILLTLYHLVFCRWREESDQSLSKTMAALNHNLARAILWGLLT